MKLKFMFAIAGLAALAISSGTATAGYNDKITGGGQVLFDTQSDARSSTLAFTAQSTTDGAKGQVQLIDRSSGGKVRFHGIVDCVETGPGPNGENFGIASGHQRGDEGQRFVLRVIDNGQGAAAEDDDMIAFDYGEDPQDTCGEGDDDANVGGVLAKGNAKVRTGDDSNNPTFESKNSASALSLLGL